MNCLDISSVEVWLCFVPVLVRVAELAVDLAVRTFCAKLIIQGSLAVVASEATPMIKTRLGRHLFGFKHLHV